MLKGQRRNFKIQRFTIPVASLGTRNQNLSSGKYVQSGGGMVAIG